MKNEKWKKKKKGKEEWEKNNTKAPPDAKPKRESALPNPRVLKAKASIIKRKEKRYNKKMKRKKRDKEKVDKKKKLTRKGSFFF